MPLFCELQAHPRLHPHVRDILREDLVANSDGCAELSERGVQVSGRPIFIHLQCWKVLPFLTIQRQRYIKFRVLRTQDVYTPLALNCQKGQHLSALEVYKDQSPSFNRQLTCPTARRMLPHLCLLSARTSTLQICESLSPVWTPHYQIPIPPPPIPHPQLCQFWPR